MQVECIRDFGGAVPGDLREVPDGAAVDPVHWRPVVKVTVDAGAAFAGAAVEAVAAARAQLDELAGKVIPGKEGM